MMPPSPRLPLWTSLLILTSALGTGCEQLGLSTPSMFDSSLSDMKAPTMKVNLLAPPSKLISMQPIRFKQQPGVKGSLVGLEPVTTTPSIRVVGNSLGSYTIGESRRVVVLGDYYPRVTCHGACAPQNWGQRVEKDLADYAARGDRFRVISQESTKNEAWMVMHRDEGVSGVRMVRYWRWEDGKEAAYLCTAELMEKKFHSYDDLFLKACQVAKTTFD